MNESKYMLTNDFKILYCPNMRLKLSCKELDLNTMEFVKYNGDLSLLELFVELKSRDIDLIIKNIFNAVIGIELSEEDMDWLKNYDRLSSINDERLTFNYCVLKLRLVGFPEEMALKITSAQFINEKLYNNYPHFSIFMDKIDEILSRRVFWISKNVNKFKTKEINYLRNIFEYKTKLKDKFNFNALRNDYLKITEESFIPHLIDFNSKSSYLIKKPLNISSQKKYLLDSYKFIIIELINIIVNNEFPHLLNQENFIYDLIDDMSSVIEFYIKILLQKEVDN